MTVTELFSHEFKLFNEVQFKTFSFGIESFQLGFNRNPDPMQDRGPQSIIFDDKGRLVINDTHKSRLLLFDLKFELINEIDLKDYSKSLFSSTYDSYIDENKYNGTVASKEVISLEKDGTLSFNLDLYESPIHKELDTGNFHILDNNVFYNLKSGEWILFYDLDSDQKKNIKNMYKGDELVTFLEKESKNIESDFYGVSIHSNFLKKGDELITRDFQTYIKYWSDVNSKVKYPNNAIDMTYDDFKKYKNIRYIGEDLDGNLYWLSGRKRFLVSNKDGWFIAGFLYNYKNSKVLPTIHPSGDIYFMNYDSEEVNLYKIPRQW